MSEKPTTTTSSQEQSCPDDCALNHSIAVFARRQGVSRSTVYEWEKRGLPVLTTRLGLRINCQQARDFVLNHMGKQSAPSPGSGCADDCNLNHPIATFARRQGVSRSTVYEWKKKGLAMIETRFGRRINCQQARAFILSQSQG
jgi:transposase-like protein